MADRNSGQKMIAVSNGAERECYFLKQIFNCSGRNTFSVLMAEEVIKRGMKAAVLLTDKPESYNMPSFFPICVTEFFPEQGKENMNFQKLVTYSTEYDRADFTARNIRMLQGRMATFEIVGVGIIGRVHLCTGSRQDIKSALAAAATAITAGIPFAKILGALNGLACCENLVSDI